MSDEEYLAGRGDLALAIGIALRRAREAKNLTQEDVGDMVGVSSEFYARIERGHALPSIATFFKLASLLQVRGDEMLGIIGPSEDRNDDDDDARRRRLAGLLAGTRPASSAQGGPTHSQGRPHTLRLVAYLLGELDKRGKQ